VTIIQTVLVFIGIPALIIGFLTLCVYGRSMMHQPNRYRPGKAWTYPPTWVVPHPDALVRAPSASKDGKTTAVGGANGEW
jgi:hypothetical protein